MVFSQALQGPRTAHQSRGKHHETAQQSEHAVHRNAYEPERNQKDPHERVDDECRQSQRPAEHEQDAPEQELHHIWTYDDRSR